MNGDNNMNIFSTRLFPYIQGAMLKRGAAALTMDHVEMEIIEGDSGRKEEKPVLYFKEKDKGLILNKTNAKVIAELYGPETEAWNGEVIELYTEKIKAFGQTHDAVRVCKPAIVKAMEKVVEESADMTTDQKKARRKKNVAKLRDTDDSAIGEDAQPPLSPEMEAAIEASQNNYSE